MKVLSYNVNGIRAALKKGFLDWLSAADPDVICIQETKAQKEQLDLKLFEDIAYPYHYWFSAEKKGYSGVAVLSKVKPNHVEYGTGIESMDFEGRNLRLDFDHFSVMSLYLPSGTNDARLDFKLNYMAEFQEYVDRLKQELPNLLICGDYNICHEASTFTTQSKTKTPRDFFLWKENGSTISLKVVLLTPSGISTRNLTITVGGATGPMREIITRDGESTIAWRVPL